MIRTEIEMDPPIRGWLRDQGFRVRGELALGEYRADLAARRDGDNLILIVELLAQEHADRRHLAQCYRWTEHTPAVYLALLTRDPDRWIENATSQEDAVLSAGLGFGILLVGATDGRVIKVSKPPRRPNPITTDPRLVKALDRYEKEGIDLVGGQRGNRAISERRSRADRVYRNLIGRAETEGLAAKWPIKAFSIWFDNRPSEGIKRELIEDDRFIFKTIRGRIFIGLAPKVEEVGE